MSETMARPRPLPPPLLSSRTPRDKAASRSASGMPGTVVGDGDGRTSPAMVGRIDPDRRFCEARGVLDQVAEDFGQVAFVDRRRQILGGVDLERQPLAAWRPLDDGR